MYSPRKDKNGVTRVDDTPAGVRKRLKEYRDLLPGIQDMVNRELRPWDEVHTIDGTDPPDKVYQIFADLIGLKSFQEAN